MTVLENVLLPLTPQGGPTRAERDAAQASLERFGLGARARTKVERLSGGERQRVAIVRALVGRPAVLLLDEPTAHLDGQHAKEVVDLLVSLRDDGGRTVVAATHDPRLAEDPRVDGPRHGGRRLVARSLSRRRSSTPLLARLVIGVAASLLPSPPAHELRVPGRWKVAAWPRGRSRQPAARWPPSGAMCVRGARLDPTGFPRRDQRRRGARVRPYRAHRLDLRGPVLSAGSSSPCSASRR
jgi:hypothetical protein